MSLKTGLEKLQGIGNTQANSLFDADMERLNDMQFGLLTMFCPGTLATGKFDAFKFPVDVYLEQVQFFAKTAPVGSSVDIKFWVGGVLDAEAFSLPDGSAQAFVNSTSNTNNGILVTAGLLIEPDIVQVGSGTAGADATIRLRYRKRVI